MKIGLKDYTTTKTAYSYFLNTIAEVANFLKALEVNREIGEDVLKQRAFSMIIQEGIFSIGAVQSELEYFLGTGLHCSYFGYLSLDETAHIIHCLIAALSASRQLRSLGLMTHSEGPRGVRHRLPVTVVLLHNIVPL